MLCNGCEFRPELYYDSESRALAGLVTGEPAYRGYCARILKDDLHCKRIAG